MPLEPESCLNDSAPARRWLCRGIAVLALAGALRAGEPAPITEHELKAAFVPKFPLFVQWPAAGGGPIVIGVFGRGNFVQALRAAVAGRNVGGRPLAVSACRNADEARRCHVVFFTEGDSKPALEVLRALAGSDVLTVGDTPGFAGQGGMVTLLTADRKVRLEVNLGALQGTALRVDPQFLQMARAVKPIARSGQ